MRAEERSDRGGNAHGKGAPERHADCRFYDVRTPRFRTDDPEEREEDERGDGDGNNGIRRRCNDGHGQWQSRPRQRT